MPSSRGLHQTRSSQAVVGDWGISEKVQGITCATLAVVAEDEGPILVRQANVFYNNVSSEEKELRILTLEKDAVTDHCQLDNHSLGNQVTFDWLDKTFNYRNEPSQCGF